MKKLMIAAAIVCAAAISQAASCSWSFTGLTPQVADNYAMNCYLIDASVTTVDAMTSALMSKNTTALGNAVESGTTVRINATATASKLAAVTLDDIAAGTSKSFYTVILDKGDATSKTYEHFYVTGVNTATSPSVGKMTAATFGNLATGDYAGSWTAVPEPTSGLLLLLGVAGLALKRKRA